LLPPAAVRDFEYFVPMVPVGRAAVLIDSADSWTSRENATESLRTGLEESVTVIVTGKTPPIVDTPEIVPVLAARLSPAGKPPEVIDQLYGVVPPVAVRIFV
jgi:hypothetical protein